MISKYKKGDQFVIKITDVYAEKEDSGTPKYAIDNMLLMRESVLDKLERFKSDENTHADFDAGYNSGLNDAWEAARDILQAPTAGGMTRSDMDAYFDTEDIPVIFDTVSASDAVEKVKEWKKMKGLKIGDEVKVKQDSGYVRFVVLMTDGRRAAGPSLGGWMKADISTLQKTGRHFSSLEEMAKAWNGE